MFRAYKYRIYPNKEQTEKLKQFFGGCRYVYNWGLEQKIKAYEAKEKIPRAFTLNKEVTHLKESEKWLSETPIQSLQYALRNLDVAYTNYYRRLKNGEKPKPPKFKSRKNPLQSFQIISNYSVDFKSQTVKIPKIKNPINAVIDRPLPFGKMKTATISMTNTGKFFISVLIDNGKENPAPMKYDKSNTIGIDLGITHYATFSNGEKIANPRFLQNSNKRLKCLQRRMSRKKKGSKNYKKAQLKVARQHERIKNQRLDFSHKLSHRIIRENHAIAVESLNIQEMMKTHYLAEKISDAGWYEFIRQLEYKCVWEGKTLLKVEEFEPTSRICSCCGHINNELKLSDREWECPACGAILDRTVNSAINIKRIALNIQYTGQKLSSEPVEPSAPAGTMKQEPQE